MAVKRAKKPSKSVVAVKETKTSFVSNYPLTNKLREPKIFIPLTIVVLAVLAFFLKGLFVAALVNGQPITRLEVIKELEKQGGKQTLSSLVNQILIFQEAKKKGIEVSQPEIDAQAKIIEEDLKKQGQNLDSALLMQGLTKEDFLMQLKIRGLVEKLLADQIKVTDKEVADYIEANKETLPTDLNEEETKKGVMQQLIQQKLAGKSQEWITAIQKNAKINYFINY